MENFCKITPVNSEHIKSKYLLSTSFFYLENSYKNSQRYIDGIKKVIKFIKKYPEYILRIYYDKSILSNDKYLQIINEIKQDKSIKNQIQLVEYFCTHFVHNGYHLGTFGTLMRFLPLFENTLSQYSIIHILDIDDNSYEYINVIIKLMEKSFKQFYFYYTEDYGKRYMDKLNNKFCDTVLANIYVKNYRFDMKIFTDYLSWISKSDKLYNILEPINRKVFSYKKLSIDILKTYGIDEYLLNKIMIKILDDSKIGWIKEDLYFDYFIEKLVLTEQISTSSIEIVQKYYIELLELVGFGNEFLSNLNCVRLKDLLMKTVKINIPDEKLEYNRKIFLSNYFVFGQKYRKITLKYYYEYYFVFNEIYIDELEINNFAGASWFIKKNWDLFPQSIKDKIQIHIVNNPCKI
jgi:hypothetical protein